MDRERERSTPSGDNGGRPVTPGSTSSGRGDAKGEINPADSSYFEVTNPPGRDQRAKDTPTGTAASPVVATGAGPRVATTTSSSSGDGSTNGKGAVESLLVHSSDVAVKPIVGNKAIEAIERPSYKPEKLPFKAADLAEVNAYSAAEVEAHLNAIYKALQRSSTRAATTPSPLLLLRRAVLAGGCRFSPTSCLSAPWQGRYIVLNTNFCHLLLRLLRQYLAP